MSTNWFPGVNDTNTGALGTVNGVITPEDASEYPAALEASTNTVYDIPLVSPVILADRTVLPRKNVPMLEPGLLVCW